MFLLWRGLKRLIQLGVVFDGMERVVAEGIDILMIDTAGRLQNKDNLMAELEKIGRIIKRVVPEAPHETFLLPWCVNWTECLGTS